MGVVSSVCFYFAILLHWVLLNIEESALIKDQPSLKHSFITVESREELRNYVHPHQGWLFAFSLLVNLWKTTSVLMQIRMTPVFGNMKMVVVVRLLYLPNTITSQWRWCSAITTRRTSVNVAAVNVKLIFQHALVHCKNFYIFSKDHVHISSCFFYAISGLSMCVFSKVLHSLNITSWKVIFSQVYVFLIHSRKQKALIACATQEFKAVPGTHWNLTMDKTL